MPWKSKTHEQLINISNKKERWKFYDDKRKDDPRLFKAKRIRSSSTWQKVRKRFLIQNPLCDDPFGHHKHDGVTVAAAEVHHIESIVDNPTLAYYPKNLQALCIQCHNRIETIVRKN